MTSRKVLITGSSRGIGRQVAMQAVADGYEVVLHGRVMTEQLMSLANDLGCELITFDVTDWEKAASAIQTLDRLDVLVNCAGINLSGPFDQLELTQWESVYAVNVFGLVGVINACLRLLRNSSSGRIVNIGSIKGHNATVGRAAYASSKAAVSNITAALAKELSPDVLVNCVAPGFVDTEMTSTSMNTRIAAQIESSLLARVARPSEIAHAILFLCSEDCSFITGQTILVDGGFSIKKE